jgi:hypothetical protein
MPQAALADFAMNSLRLRLEIFFEPISGASSLDFSICTSVALVDC